MEEVINVLELRNYLLRPGMRSEFSNYFAEHLVQPQIDMGGYVLGQYQVKDAPDNFLWLRGFHSMETRTRFLPGFYGGPIWKQHRQNANSMILNSDNVHLLKPLIWDGNSLAQGNGIRANLLKREKSIAVIDYYIANTKLDKLIAFFGHVYIPLLRTTRIEQNTFWVSELMENDFPALPVFQDKNLLVAITFYNDEAEYQAKHIQLESQLTPELKDEMMDLVTTQNRLVIIGCIIGNSNQD
jgi:hypothetical protein